MADTRQMNELDRQITALEGRLGQLRGDLQAAEGKMTRLVTERAILRTGINIGDIVYFEGNQIKVTRLRDWGNNSPPWLWGNPVRKDGSIGTSVRTLYDKWTKPEPTGGGI